MSVTDRQEWEEFLDWFEDNKWNLPEWVNPEMSMHECRMLWKERVKNDNHQV